MLKGQILHPIVEDQSVATIFLHRKLRRPHPILIHQHDHIAQRLGEHVGLIPRQPTIQEHPGSVMYSPGLTPLQPQPLALQPPKERRPLRFITPTQNRHPTTTILQSPRKHLHHTSFSSSSNRQIPHRDDQTSWRMIANNPSPIQPKSRLNSPTKKPAQPIKEPTQKRGTLPVSTIKNDIDRKLLKRFEPLTHRLAQWGVHDGFTHSQNFAPQSSARVKISRA